jgi:predicted AlkP superfamily phosphohydrolase/phosphomutase
LHISGDEGGTLATLHVLATDQPDEGPGSYDLLFLDSDKDLQNGHSSVSLGECKPVTVSPRLHSGAYFCFTASEGPSVTLYRSRVSYNRGRPAELLRSVNELGFPPPVPDREALHLGWLLPKQYYEMAERRAKWMMDVVLHVYRTYQPDLLLTAQEIIADCARAFLLVDERQQAYEPELAELYAGYRRQAHEVADENLGQLLSLVNVANSAVLVVSGHGLAPVHTEVHLNTILEDAGLLDLDTGEGQVYMDPEESEAVALASEGSAHIYLNLQGRDQPGIVAPDDYENVQQQVVAAVTEVADEDGQPIFARILTREQLRSVQLNSPYAGDVFVQAAPGYCLSDALGFEDVLAPSVGRAGGALGAVLPEMHGIFVVAGANLARGKATAAVHLTDIAPTIARLLEFEPASTVRGHSAEGAWR